MQAKTATNDVLDTSLLNFSLGDDDNLTQALKVKVTDSYYRSLTFNSSVGINPLITCAAPLFTLLARLQENYANPDSSDLHQHILHEIRAFESNAKRQKFRSETIFIARYLLCCSLDEAICSSQWGKQNHWAKHQILRIFHGDENPDERFFLILERLLNDPKQHLDLLEFIYLCLSMGYEGKYRQQTRGQVELSELIDNLYHIIYSQRPEMHSIFDNFVLHKVSAQPKLKTVKYWRVAIFTALVLSGIYVFTNVLLDSQAENFYQQAITTTSQPMAANYVTQS